MVVTTQGEWVNKWMKWADFLCWCKFRKVKNLIIFGWLWSKIGICMRLWFQWMNESGWIFACYNTCLRKIKVTLIVIGGHGQIWVLLFRSKHCCIRLKNEWMNELNWFFAYSYMVSGKLKVTLGIHMVKLMNWADFLHAGSDGIILNKTINLALYLRLLNAGLHVVVLYCSCYFLRFLLNFVLPQSFSHGQYCSIFPNFAFQR